MLSIFFMCLLAVHLSFREMPVQILCPVLNWFVFPAVFKLYFSIIHLIAANLWLLSRVLTKLFLTVFCLSFSVSVEIGACNCLFPHFADISLEFILGVGRAVYWSIIIYNVVLLVVSAVQHSESAIYIRGRKESDRLSDWTELTEELKAVLRFGR